MTTSAILAAIDTEIARLQQAKELLSDLNTTTARKPGRPRKTDAAVARPKRHLSAEARARIAAAQKTRWAKAKKVTRA